MKKFCVLLAVFSLLFTCSFSEESLKEQASGVWKEVKGAVKGAGESIDGAIKNVTSRLYTGKWEFVNGECSTVLECFEDGKMTVTQSDGLGDTVWSGTYTADTSTLNFKVSEKTSKVLLITKKDSLDEEWTFSVSLCEWGNELKITSESLPDDENGYDFSRSTLFTLIKE